MNLFIDTQRIDKECARPSRTTRIRLLAFSTLILSSVFLACSGDESGPTDPNTLNIAGDWSGTADDNFGPSTLIFDLRQSGATVSGTFSKWAVGGGLPTEGTISGTVSGNTFQGEMNGGYFHKKQRTAHDCVVKLSFATNISDNDMTGTFSGTDSCTNPVTDGTIDLAKQ